MAILVGEENQGLRYMFLNDEWSGGFRRKVLAQPKWLVYEVINFL